MIRLFVGIALPDWAAASLALLQRGIAGARWIAPGEMHLTLRFIGEVDERAAEEIDLALAALTGAPFTLALQGVGQFGDAAPHALWAGVAPSEPLARLAAKVEQAVRRAGQRPETRRFTPHVTLARLKNVPLFRVTEFLSDHGLFRAEPFLVREFTLFSSHLGHGGSHYVPEAAYPLERSVVSSKR